MRKHLGQIALDIDGTITDATHHAPEEVVHFLHSLEEKGWEITFITGRTFAFASRVVGKFDFPFYLAVQNGADILLMPEKKRVVRHYLDEKALAILQQAYEGEQEDFLIYAGYEQGDFCYFRPERFSVKMRAHLRKIMALSPEPWKEVESFDFKQGLAFPLAKCLGTKESMQRVCKRLQMHPELSATLIRDPLAADEDAVYLILVTGARATKGEALNSVKELTGGGGVTIAAGDDLNDVSMLEVADIKIVMASAPSEMLPMATLVAEHGQQHGIITALNKAILT